MANWLVMINFGIQVTKSLKWLISFPTCQVRVVRFYQSCSPPPPRLAVLLLLLVLLLLILLLLPL